MHHQKLSFHSSLNNITHNNGLMNDFLKLKRDKSKENNLIKCPRCDKEYKSITAQKAHIVRKHKDEVEYHKKFKFINTTDIQSMINNNITHVNPNKNYDLAPFFGNLHKIEDFIKVIQSTKRKREVNFTDKNKSVDEFFSISKILQAVFIIIYNGDKNKLTFQDIIDNKSSLSENSTWTEAHKINKPPSKVSCLTSFIFIQYKNSYSYKDIPLLNLIHSHIIENKLMVRNSSISIDYALVLFFYFNMTKLNSAYLMFLLKILCLLREFINLKYYIKYHKTNYTSCFSSIILPNLCFEFLQLLSKDMIIDGIDNLDIKMLNEKLRVESKFLDENNTSLPFNEKENELEKKNFTCRIVNINKFFKIIKSNKRKRTSNGLDQSLQDSLMQSNEKTDHKLSLSETINNPKDLLGSLTSESTKSSIIKEFKEVFLFIDFFCVWLNKNNYSNIQLGSTMDKNKKREEENIT